MIKATIIKDSISGSCRITTFELEYPRFIHAELLTHRLFSRNSASSRAIPISTMNANIAANPAEPIHWGKNQPGMQANEELDVASKVEVQSLWKLAMEYAVDISTAMFNKGVHKQVANRVTEPYQHMKVVLTATEYSNWYDLRDHKDADPNIAKLARTMRIAMDASTPQELNPGEWHLPYIHTEFLEDKITYSVNDVMLTLEEAKMISASQCAQVSYRKSDDTLEKAKMIYDKLINSRPQHASPIEHQATPMQSQNDAWAGDIWEQGITHCDRRGDYWSNNFRGWIQHRSII